MRSGHVLAIVCTILALAACGSEQPDSPGDVTVSEAKALDEAAEMIEARRPPPPVADPSAPLPPDTPVSSASERPR